MGMSFKPVSGCEDLLPVDAETRQRAIDIILKAYQNAGFLLVKTPVLDSLDLLCGGDESDNATKLMFKTIKRGAQLDLTKENLKEKDITEEGLKYDQTVPLARLFANNRNNLPMPFKAIQIDESFRAERPQKGRNRQFTQCDIDIIGDKTNLADVEVISTGANTYKALGLKNIEIRISSRQVLTSIIKWCGYTEEQVNSVCIIVDKLDKIGTDGVLDELNTNFTNKANNKKLTDTLKEIKESKSRSLTKYGVSEQDASNLNEIIKLVSKTLPKGYTIVFDITIVRGQSYYTGSVFEFYVKDAELTKAVGGGGRYDNMLEKLTGEKISAVGFSIGLVPTMLVAKNNPEFKTAKKIALVFKKDADLETVLAKKQELMKTANVSVFAFPNNFNEFERRLKLNGYDEIIKI